MSDERAAADRRRIDQFLSQTPLVTPGSRSRGAHRRRVDPAVLPRGPVGRIADRARAARRADRVRVASLRRSVGSAPPDAAARAGHPGAFRSPSGFWRCRISATSRCRHISAPEACTDTPRLYHEAIEFIVRLQRRGAELASDGVHAVPAGVRRREADVGARLLRHPFRGGLSPRRPVGGRTNGAVRRVEGDRRRAGRRAARAVPPGLPQPEPDGARRRPVRHRLPGRAHGTGHLRPRLPAARFVRRHRRRRARGADRVLPGARGRTPTPAEFRRRFDLMAVQRNLKALGTFGNQAGARGNPAYIQYMPRTLAYARTNLARYPRFARLRELLAAHIRGVAYERQ